MSYGWRTISGRDVELCDECGYDARLVDDEGRELDAVFTALAGLCDHPDAARRPGPDVFSGEEYVEHCVQVTNGFVGYVTRVTDLPGQPPATDLAEARSTVATVVAGLNSTNRRARLSGEFPFEVTVEWLVRRLLHDLQHHVLDIRRGYARLAMADHPEVYTVKR